MAQLPQIITLSPEKKATLIDTGIKVVLLAGAAWGASVLWKRYKRDQEEKKAATDPIAQMAQMIHDSLNPSGIKLFKSFDTTNTSGLYQAASQITDLKAVAESYKKLYGSNLMADLEKELGAEDYQKFLNILKFNPSTKSNKQNPPVKAGTLFVTRSKTRIRKTPLLQDSFEVKDLAKFVIPAWGFYDMYRKGFHGNTIAIADPNTKVGYSTGNFHYDKENDVLFIELTTIASDSNKRIYYWVAKSQLLPVSAEVYNANPLRVQIKEKDLLSGINESFIKTHSKAPIYSPEGDFICDVKKGVVLGSVIGELKTGKGRLYLFKSIQGHKRWVNEKFVTVH